MNETVISSDLPVVLLLVGTFLLCAFVVWLGLRLDGIEHP